MMGEIHFSHYLPPLCNTYMYVYKCITYTHMYIHI